MELDEDIRSELLDDLGDCYIRELESKLTVDGLRAFSRASKAFSVSCAEGSSSLSSISRP